MFKISVWLLGHTDCFFCFSPMILTLFSFLLLGKGVICESLYLLYLKDSASTLQFSSVTIDISECQYTVWIPLAKSARATSQRLLIGGPLKQRPGKESCLALSQTPVLANTELLSHSRVLPGS